MPAGYAITSEFYASLDFTVWADGGPYVTQNLYKQHFTGSGTGGFAVPLDRPDFAHPQVLVRESVSWPGISGLLRTNDRRRPDDFSGS